MKFDLGSIANSWLTLQSSISSPFAHNAVSDARSTSLVTLKGYGSFQGIQVNTTLTGRPLPATVDAWLGIEYALQPVEERRFLPIVENPVSFQGIRSADQYGKVCIQDTATTTYAQDEACLNFNVFRTAGVSRNQKVPVLVWIHGGGFVEGSGRSLDGAAFVAASPRPIAVVTFNYRLNSLGFLPSKLFAEEGLLNIGLRDQKHMLQFLHQHLPSFGIDTRQITLGGRSAGAHSAAFHYVHNYNEDRDKPLFARAILQSGASTARGFPNATNPLNEYYFNQFMTQLGCPTAQPTKANNKAALSCLRTANISKIQSISTKLWLSSQHSLNWPFQPTQGGPLLEKPGSQSLAEGTFHHLPLLTSTVTNEGKFYVPGTLTTTADFIEYFANLSPRLNTTDLALLHTLYPDPLTDSNSPYSNAPNSTQYNRLAAAWSDYAYICPSRHTAQTLASTGTPVWKLRFNVPSYPLEYTSWRGIPHTSDTRYTFASPDVPFFDTGLVYHAYLASFVLTGDPNSFRYHGVPEWPRYEGSKGGDRGWQVVVHPGTNVVVERDAIRVEPCTFWNDLARMVRLDK